MVDEAPVETASSHYVDQMVRTLVKADPNAYVDQVVRNLREIVNAGFSARDEAVRLLHEDMVRVPTLLDRVEAKIVDLFDARLLAQRELIDQKFAELEKRSKDLDEARATALIAALAAAKELVGVQSTSSSQMIAAANANFTKQIDGMQTAFSGQLKASEDRYTDLKERFTAIAATMEGTQTYRENRRGEIGTILGVVGALAFVAAAVFGGISLFH